MTWQPMGAVELRSEVQGGVRPQVLQSSPPCVVWDKESKRHILISLRAADGWKGLPALGGGRQPIGTQSYAALPVDFPLTWRLEGALSPLPMPASKEGHHLLSSLFGFSLFGSLGMSGSRLVGPFGIARQGRRWWLFVTEQYFGGWLGGKSGYSLRLFHSESVTEGTWTEVSLCTTVLEIRILPCLE